MLSLKPWSSREVVTSKATSPRDSTMSFDKPTSFIITSSTRFAHCQLIATTLRHQLCILGQGSEISRILHVACWIQYPESMSILDPVSWIMDPRSRILAGLDAGSWIWHPIILKPHPPRNNHVVDHNHIAILCTRHICGVTVSRSILNSTLKSKCKWLNASWAM